MAFCQRCERIEEHVHVTDLSEAECYALAYAQAMAGGQDSPAMRRFMAGERRLAATVNEKTRTSIRQAGLQKLADLGIVKLKRSALAGEWDLESYDGSKLVGGNLIAGDFS